MLALRAAALSSHLQRWPSLRLTGTDGAPAFAHLLQNCPLPGRRGTQGRPGALRRRATKSRGCWTAEDGPGFLRKRLGRALAAALVNDWVAKCRMKRATGVSGYAVPEVEDATDLRGARTSRPLPFDWLRRCMDNECSKELDTSMLPTLWDWLLVSHLSVLLSERELLWLLGRWPAAAWAGPPRNLSRLAEITDLAFSKIRQFRATDFCALVRHVTRLGLTLPLSNLAVVIASCIGTPAEALERGPAPQRASVEVGWACFPPATQKPSRDDAGPITVETRPLRVCTESARIAGLRTGDRDRDPFFSAFSLSELSQLFRLTARHPTLSHLLLTSIVWRTRAGEHEAIHPFSQLELLTALVELLGAHLGNQHALCGNATAKALVRETATALAADFVARTLRSPAPYPPEVLCFIIAQLAQLQAIRIEDPLMQTAIDVELQRLIHGLQAKSSDCQAPHTDAIKCDRRRRGAGVPSSLTGFAGNRPPAVFVTLACALKGLRCAGLRSVSNAVVSAAVEITEAHSNFAAVALTELVALLPRDCDAGVLEKLIKRCSTEASERPSNSHFPLGARLAVRLMHQGQAVPEQLLSSLQTGAERGCYWPKTLAEWQALNPGPTVPSNPDVTGLSFISFNPFTEISSMQIQQYIQASHR